MRIVMMGTGPFAIPSFRAIHESSHEILALYTRPVRAARRSKQPVNPMKEVAEELGIEPIFAPESINDVDTVEELKALNEVLGEKSGAYNQENILYHQQQNRLNSLLQEIGFKQTTFDASKERIGKNTEELKNTEDEIRELLRSAENNDEELIAMYEEKESFEQAVNQAEKDYYGIRGDIDELEKEVREIQRSRESIDSLIMELQNQLNETKLDLNSVKERLSVEFNIDIDRLLIEVQSEEEDLPEQSEEELRNKVQKTKDSMERIGPINPMAMEAYEEIKERHDFIITQKEIDPSQIAVHRGNPFRSRHLIGDTDRLLQGLTSLLDIRFDSISDFDSILLTNTVNIDYHGLLAIKPCFDGVLFETIVNGRNISQAEASPIRSCQNSNTLKIFCGIGLTFAA